MADPHGWTCIRARCKERPYISAPLTGAHKNGMIARYLLPQRVFLLSSFDALFLPRFTSPLTASTASAFKASFSGSAVLGSGSATCPYSFCLWYKSNQHGIAQGSMSSFSTPSLVNRVKVISNKRDRQRVSPMKSRSILSQLGPSSLTDRGGRPGRLWHSIQSTSTT